MHMTDSLEQRTDISLGRVALTTLGYGFVGCLFDDATIVAPLTATVGLAAVVYDEVKQKGMNLIWPAAGIFVGGLIGSLFDINTNEHWPNAVAHTGAAIGGTLGFYKSYRTRESAEE